MDYGFHAPTISLPVAGTLMVEPTESESQDELDRFCDAMISIHAEMTPSKTAHADRAKTTSSRTPRTPPTRSPATIGTAPTRASKPPSLPWLHDYKFWPAVGRVDNVFGDRNPVCSCVGMENYS